MNGALDQFFHLWRTTKKKALTSPPNHWRTSRAVGKCRPRAVGGQTSREGGHHRGGDLLEISTAEHCW